MILDDATAARYTPDAAWRHMRALVLEDAVLLALPGVLLGFIVAAGGPLRLSLWAAGLVGLVVGGLMSALVTGLALADARDQWRRWVAEGRFRG